MAVVAQIQKLTAKLLLNNGTSPTGNVKTVSLNITSTTNPIDDENYKTNTQAVRESVVTITAALTPCLTKSLYDLQEQITNKLTVE